MDKLLDDYTSFIVLTLYQQLPNSYLNNIVNVQIKATLPTSTADGYMLGGVKMGFGMTG